MKVYMKTNPLQKKLHNFQLDMKKMAEYVTIDSEETLSTYHINSLKEIGIPDLHFPNERASYKSLVSLAKKSLKEKLKKIETRNAVEVESSKEALLTPIEKVKPKVKELNKFVYDNCRFVKQEPPNCIFLPND